jgi:hypothetical protein
MSWLKHVTNPEFLKELFQNEPALVGVRALELTMSPDGPTVKLRININEFPSNPPQKWKDMQANTVQLTMSFIDVTGLALQGLSTQCVVDIDVQRQSDMLHVQMAGDITAEFKCLAIYLDKVTAYSMEPQAKTA